MRMNRFDRLAKVPRPTPRVEPARPRREKKGPKTFGVVGRIRLPLGMEPVERKARAA